MYYLLVANMQVTGDARPDSEVLAGRELRRQRQSKGWSHEEVAQRMRAYGYRFSKTMIAEIEFGQHPLRVRELADFAALFCIEVYDLIHPASRPERSLAEIDQEIAELQHRWKQLQEALAALTGERRMAQAALNRVEAEQKANQRDALAVQRKLIFLREARKESVLLQAADIPVQRRRRTGRRAAPLP